MRTRRVVPSLVVAAVLTAGSAMGAAGDATVVAGAGTLTIDGVQAHESDLADPRGVAVDAQGNLLIAESQAHRVRRVDRITGVISTFAGTGEPGLDGDGGPATAARLLTPTDLEVDRFGNVYILDIGVSSNSGDERIRRVLPDGTITTFAGGRYDTAVGTFGGPGFPWFARDTRPAALLWLSFSSGIAVDQLANVFVTNGGWMQPRILKITAAGMVLPYAGTGEPGFSGDGGPATEADLGWPRGLAVAPDGALYIADYGNNRIRRVGADGVITTVAGTGEQHCRVSPDGSVCSVGAGGPATDAVVGEPQDVAIDPAGNVFLTANRRLHRIDAATGIFTTVTGAREFEYPTSVALTGDRDAYFADRISQLVYFVEGPL